MKNLLGVLRKEIFPISLILILVFARLIPHPPNFTPIIAVAILSSCFFRNVYLSIAILLVSMLLADVVIGFYKDMLFVYISLLLIPIIFFKANSKINYKNLFIFGFVGALIFYLVSNFGVWLVGNLYSKDIDGLVECYYLAIPFFRNTLFSTIFYSYFGLFLMMFINRFSLKTEKISK